MSAPILIEGLRKHYGRKSVLEGVNLTVEPGAVYGLVGANGTGKTTTIKILMNMIAADAGRAEILGRPSSNLGPATLARIGYVSENQQLPGWMTVDYFFNYLRPFYPNWDDQHCAALRRQMDLPGDRRLDDLSRGMRMKAALVSVLAYRPELLILDEPFSGLDPLVRDELAGSLLEQATGMTVLLSSHDLAEMETFASHIGFLEDGHLRFSEETAALAARFREIEVTVGDAPAAPVQWPAAWLVRESSAAVIRFVDSQYQPAASEERLRALFPHARGWQVRPMSLRQIFIALASSARKQAA